MVFRESTASGQGGDEPVGIFEPLGFEGEVDKETLEALEAGSRRCGTTGRRSGIRPMCRSTTCRGWRRIAIFTSSTPSGSPIAARTRRARAGTA